MHGHVCVLQVNGEVAQDEIHPEWGPQPQHIDDETQYILILGVSEPDKPREPGLCIRHASSQHAHCHVRAEYRPTHLNQLELELAITTAHSESEEDVAQCGASEPFAPVSVTPTWKCKWIFNVRLN